MPRFFWFQFRMLLEIGGLALFFYGYFTPDRLLTDIGGGIVIGFDLLSIWVGLLNPLFPVLATIVVAAFFDPWRDGAYWVAAVFACFDVPFYLVWLIQPPMQAYEASRTAVSPANQSSLPPSIAHFSLIEPPQSRRNRAWPYLVTVIVVGVIAVAVIAMRGQEFPHIFPGDAGPSVGTTSQDGPTTTSDSSPPTGTPQNDLPIWKHGSFANNTVTLDYPSNGFIDSDEPRLISISTVVDGFTLLWGENVTGSDIDNIIATRDTDPNFAERYKEFINHYMSEELEAGGGTIVTITDPDIRRISHYQVIVVEVVLRAPQQTGTHLLRMLMFNFDCAEFACQAQYYKAGDAPFTPAEWARAEHILGSISFTN